MEATIASSGIVHEVLTKDNYKIWSIVVKNYLLGHGLWGVVESTVPDSAKKVENEALWRIMNAKALHIIQLACGKSILEKMSDYEKAKDAWNYLSATYGSELKATPDIEQGVVDDSLREYKELHRQVERGDWNNAFLSIRKDRAKAIFSVSSSGRTVLHVAVIAGHVDMVEKLVKVGKDELVKMQDNQGCTALALAAELTGNTEIAKCMLEKKVDGELLGMEDNAHEIPVLLAAAKGHKEMTRYLYDKTPKHVLDGDSRNRASLLTRCITAEIFDVALRLLQRYPELPRECCTDDGFTALRELANMPHAFPSGSRFGLRQQFIYDILSVERKFEGSFAITKADIAIVPRVADEGRQKTSLAGKVCRWVLNFLLWPVKNLGRLLLVFVYVFVHIFKFLNIFGIREIYDQKYTHYEVQGILSYLYKSIAKFEDSELEAASAYEAMLHAAKHGIIEFINAVRESNPDLLWAMDNYKRGIFSYAVMNRKQKVFQLIHSINGRKEIIKYRADVFGNNLLHLAGQLGPPSDRDRRSGAALQMQREIQWFKAVEEVVHPKCKEAENDDHKKPHEVFSKEHEELVKAGEKWAKDTAGSFTLVGTLIITIMFAAAFTVPGGNNQDSGVPIFLHKKIFTAFIIADAVSLFTSATSVLIFIWILTSRYAEKDFLKSLPWKLLLGFVILFMSVVSMMVAFCAALAMLLKGYRAYRWLFIGAMSLASIPVIVLVLSQLRLLLEIFRSTWSNPIKYNKKYE